MPIISLEVPETYDNITRPVNIAIVKDLINRLSLPNHANIRYGGGAEAIAQHGSLLANKNDPVTFPYGDLVHVEIEEEYVEENLLSTAVKTPDNMVIFIDNPLGVYLRPVYTKTRTTISFRYRASDKTTAMRWRDSIRRRTTEGKQAMLHEVIYHYSVPDAFFAILRDIHLKRETIAGYNEEFETWLLNNFTDRLTTLSNLNGQKGIPVIGEKQIGVQGWFGFVTEPEKADKTREGGSWEVGFDYTYEFDKVTAVTMAYPIVIHNQLLDPKYLPEEKPYDLYEQPRRPSLSGHLNEYFSPLSKNLTPTPETLVIPSNDDWAPTALNLKTYPFISLLIGIDLDDPTFIVNLKDMGEFSLSDEVLEFLSLHHDKLPHYLALPFHLAFFKGKNLVDATNITVDIDLNVRTTIPMSPREMHHLQFSILMDLRLLSDYGSNALRANPELCKTLVDLIAELNGSKSVTSRFNRAVNLKTNHTQIKPRPGQTNGIPKSIGLPSDELIVLGNKYITEPSFNMAIAKLRTDKTLSAVGQGRGLKTVMNAGIIVHREN